MIGQYAHGNEPSHHVAYLYNNIGKPEKTRKLVMQIMKEMYRNTPDGICGNEDCGQMSAWYVMSAMGFYPVDPCGGEYELGVPLFPEVKLHLADGKVFTVTSKGDNKKAFFNGKRIKGTTITHKEIMSGGVLEFK
jgi:predicted alpha-1,2-mannosidase